MCKIGILFENRDFEHDVYELIKAFYPEAEIHTLYENAEAEYDLRFSVERDNDSYIIKYERTENLSKQETEQKGVISADILSKKDAGYGMQDAHALRKENKDTIKYALYPGDALEISGKSAENSACHHYCKQGKRDSEGY